MNKSQSELDAALTAGDLVGVRVVAQAIGRSVQRVHHLVGMGMPRVGRDQYDLHACMAWFIRYLQAEQARRAAAAPSASLLQERKDLVAAQREKYEIANKQRRSELLEAEDVRREWKIFVADVKRRLRAVAPAVGPQLTNISDPATIVARLKREIDAALTELATS